MGSYGAEADVIFAEFAAKLAGLRRRLPRWEIPTAVRALQADKQAALAALRERRQGECFAAREITRRAGRVSAHGVAFVICYCCAACAVNSANDAKRCAPSG